MGDVHINKPWPIKPIVGSTLAIGDIVGRDDWILDVLIRMREGNNFVCNDPRRFGKTTAARRLVNEPGDRVTALFIDYEGIATPTDFLIRTVKVVASNPALWKTRVRKTVERLFSGAEFTAKGFGLELKIKASQLDRSPIDLLHDVLAAVETQLDDDELLLLVLDEVPLAVRNIARNLHSGPDDAAYLLQQLRHARQSFTQIRWLITGSIGFHHVLKECTDTTAGVIGDLQNLPLGPLNNEGASLLAECLALGIERDLNEEAKQKAVAVTGGVPFLLQALFHTLRSTGDPETIETIHVTTAFDSYLDNRDESRAIDHFLERLDDYLSTDLKRAADELLDVIAVEASIRSSAAVELIRSDDEPTTDESRELINMLIDDHYLIQSNGELAWRYQVFRQIWIVRRGLQP